MTDLVEQILSYKNIRLWKALSDQEVDRLEGELGRPLPEQINRLLRRASGFNTIKDTELVGPPPRPSRELRYGVDFSGRLSHFSFDGILDACAPIASTAGGDHWVVDVISTGEWNNVFYCSNNPPAALIQFHSLSEFIEAAATRRYLVDDDLLEATCSETRSINAGDAKRERHHDDAIRQFAQELPDKFDIYDLRPGSGVTGMAFGESTKFMRFGDELIFAQYKEPKSAASSWLSGMVDKFKNLGA